MRRFRHVQVWRDKRTKQVYFYFRKRGAPRVRLPGPYGSEAFRSAYYDAIENKIEIGADRSKAGSVSAAIAAYYQAPSFKTLADGTKGMRRAILERFRDKFGTLPIGRLEARHVAKYLGNLSPHAARNHLKGLRGLLQHAGHDVTAGMKPPKVKSQRHRSWTEAEQAQYRKRHKLGTMARLAFEIAAGTGMATTDICRFGPSHVRDGEWSNPRQKTGVVAMGEILPNLKVALAAMDVTGLATFLVTKRGKAFRANGRDGLSACFRTWCAEAGLPAGLHIHGLRHTMGDTIAEAGGSAHAVAAVLGHASARMAIHYTQGADRKRLARDAMAKLKVSKSNRDLTENEPKSLKNNKAGRTRQ